VINSAASFDVNLLFTATLDEADPYTPHLEFFDPLTGIDQDGQAHSSLISGFYYVNTPPFMTTIVNVEVNEGGTAVVDSSHLVAQDFESGPAGLTYTIDPEDNNGIPQHGELDNLGTPLTTFDTFTQAEVNADAISYIHDGTETTLDSYTFTVHDEEGAIAADGPFTVFKNTINVTTFNDPPTAIDGSGTAGIDGVYNGMLEGEDEEGDPLEFSIVSVDIGAALVNDTNTGSFTYTGPIGYEGDAIITFQVWDGNSFAIVPGEFTVTVPVNEPPTAKDGSGTAGLDGVYNGTLEGEDPEGQPLEFSIVSVDIGAAQVNDINTGSFTYTAPNEYVGDAIITFQVWDGNSLAIVPGEFTVTVLDPSVAVVNSGDLLIANGDLLILHNLPENTDWVLSSGDNFTNLSAIAFDGESQIYVLDRNNGLIRVDPVSGAQTVIATGDNFSSNSPGSIAVEDINHVLVANLDFEGTPSILRVDTTNGNISTLSSGGLIAVPTATAVGADGKVYVTDASAFMGGTSSVVEIDPSNGSQSTVSLGNLFIVPLDIAVEANGNLLVADTPVGLPPDGVNRILRIVAADPPGDIGSQSILSEGGHILESLRDITTGFNGKIYAANGTNVLDIDPVTGAQTIVTTEAVVTAPTDVEIVLMNDLFSDSFEDPIPVPD
jgi:hypothetical protein